MHLKKVGRRRLTSAERAARFGSAMRRDVTLRRGHGEKIRPSWPRAKRARACHSAAGWPDQPAEWTRPRWRRGDWRRVTKRDPVRTVAIRAHVYVRGRARVYDYARMLHAWEGNATRDRQGVDVATPWRRPNACSASVAAKRRPGATPRCNGDVQVAACTRLAHGGARARLVVSFT